MACYLTLHAEFTCPSLLSLLPLHGHAPTTKGEEKFKSKYI